MKLVKLPIAIEGPKRQYLPYEIHKTCEKCKAKLIKNFNDEYLMYPVSGKIYKTGIYCENCDKEYPVKLRFDFLLEIVE